MSDFKIKFKKLVSSAIIPKQGSKFSAGFDLSSIETGIIKARQRACIATGLSLEFPEGYQARIAPRSGLALKNGIAVGAGVVDCDQRGEVKVILFNHSDQDQEQAAGDRIAQVIFEQIAQNVVIEEVLELNQTARGEGGLGSTGVQQIKQ